MEESLSTSGEVPGEPVGVEYTAEEKRFLVEVAHANLESVESDDKLKHFADVWWNLCNWEGTRAGVLDGKAQGLLALASIASAVVTVTASLGSETSSIDYLRAAGLFMFVLAAALAVFALRVSDHGGFLDRGVFEALGYTGEADDWFPAFSDKDPFRLYLREISMQRWAVYRAFKDASNKKAAWIKWAQYAALAGTVLLGVSVLAHVSSHIEKELTSKRPDAASQAQPGGGKSTTPASAASK